MPVTGVATKLETVFAFRPAERVTEGQQVRDVVICGCGAAAERLIGGEVHLSGSQTNHDGIPGVIREESLRFLTGFRIVESVERISADATHSDPSFVNQRR